MPRSVRIAIACGVALLVCGLGSAVLKFVEPGNLLGDFVFVGIVGAAFPVAPFAGATVIFALLVVMAFALSRPSAKGWFDSRRPA